MAPWRTIHSNSDNTPDSPAPSSAASPIAVSNRTDRSRSAFARAECPRHGSARLAQAVHSPSARPARLAPGLLGYVSLRPTGKWIT